MLKELFLVLFVCLMALVADTEADPCERNGANGCSIPGNLPFPYKRKFRAACNRHDICYSCGVSKNISQYSCDRFFYSNMKKTCKYFICKGFATIYYKGVRARGHKHFKNPSKNWCNESWVNGCMK